MNTQNLTISGTKNGNKLSAYINGELFSKVFKTNERAIEALKLLHSVRQNPTPEGIEELMNTLSGGARVEIVKGIEHNEDENKYFLTGSIIEVPEGVVNMIKEYQEAELPTESLENFLKLLVSNPDKRVRDQLFNHIEKHNIVITENGYLVLYKSVGYRNSNTKVAEFVSLERTRVRIQKLNPTDFLVYQNESNGELMKTTKDEDVDTTVWSFVGNLQELFESIDSIVDNMNETMEFTDLHTRKMKIRLGEVVKMERKMCDGDPSNDCSYGLHVGAKAYVDRFGSKTERAILICLVNPMNVVAVPNYDHSKMRVSEYFPIALNEVDDEGNITAVEGQFYESDYKDYEDAHIEEKYNELFDAFNMKFGAFSNTEKEVTELTEQFNNNLSSSRVIELNEDEDETEFASQRDYDEEGSVWDDFENEEEEWFEEEEEEEEEDELDF
jgi:hypothetical protein